MLSHLFLLHLISSHLPLLPYYIIILLFNLSSSLLFLLHLISSHLISLSFLISLLSSSLICPYLFSFFFISSHFISPHLFPYFIVILLFNLSSSLLHLISSHLISLSSLTSLLSSFLISFLLMNFPLTSSYPYS